MGHINCKQFKFSTDTEISTHFEQHDRSVNLAIGAKSVLVRNNDRDKFSRSKIEQLASFGLRRRRVSTLCRFRVT